MPSFYRYIEIRTKTHTESRKKTLCESFASLRRCSGHALRPFGVAQDMLCDPSALLRTSFACAFISVLLGSGYAGLGLTVNFGVITFTNFYDFFIKLP